MSTDDILPQRALSKPTVYVLECRDGSLYTGATVDLRRRLFAHRRGAAKYTRGRLPVSLLACWHPPTFATAKSHEARFKRLRRAEKLAVLASGKAYGCRVYSNVRAAAAYATRVTA